MHFHFRYESRFQSYIGELDMKYYEEPHYRQSKYQKMCMQCKSKSSRDQDHSFQRMQRNDVETNTKTEW